MKGFFELLGFCSMAILSGFLVFTFIGHNKKSLRGDAQEMRSEYNAGENAPQELPAISNARGAGSSAASGGSERKRSKAGMTASGNTSSANATERLRDLYEDQQFVTSTVQKWKRAVADANEAHTLRPDVLMSNIIVRSYLGAYAQRDFNQDVAEHAGDCAVSASNALKTYEYGWSMSKLMQQYDLSKYFPAPVASAFRPKSKVAEANVFALGSSKSAPSAAPKITKPVAATSAAESGFRDMVAKEEGFSSWAGLQKLGDIDTKQNAERRVKRLLSAARVR
mgnify:CR=1 FL=1